MTRATRSKKLQDAYTLACQIRHAVVELDSILQELEDEGCPPTPSVKEYLAGVGLDAVLLQGHLQTAVLLALNWREEDER